MAEEKKKPTKKTTTSKTKTTSKTTTKKATPKKVETKKVEVKKATPKKVETKKVEVKKTTPKKVETKKVEVKKTTPKKVETKKVETKKATPKKVETKKVETKQVEVTPVVEIIENNKLEETITDLPVINEEPKNNDELEIKENNNVIVIFLIFIVAIFIGGIIYIYNYSQDSKIEEKEVSNDVLTVDPEKKAAEPVKEETKETKEETKETPSSDEIEDYSNLKTLSIADYQTKAKNNEKMIILLASRYCGHCTIFEPILNQALVDKKINGYKIDVALLSTEDKNTFDEIFKITGTPTTVIVENGKITVTKVGSMNAESTTTWLNENY